MGIKSSGADSSVPICEGNVPRKPFQIITPWRAHARGRRVKRGIAVCATQGSARPCTQRAHGDYPTFSKIPYYRAFHVPTHYSASPRRICACTATRLRTNAVRARAHTRACVSWWYVRTYHRRGLLMRYYIALRCS